MRAWLTVWDANAVWSVAEWSAYQTPPSFVLGFHGTQSLVVRQVVTQEVRHLDASRQPYDWLGHGVYFWENDPLRAQEWAQDRFMPNADVLGGILDLGYCLDLTTRMGCDEVALAYQALLDFQNRAGHAMPTNSIGQDLLRRELDCKVIMYLHRLRHESGHRPYDSVRAAFIESEPLYEGAGFRKKNHIQICIRTPENCIKGYFKPILLH